MFRSMSGLGILETSSTGVRSVVSLSCITAEEKAEANAKCPPTGQIRGLGVAGSRALSPMSGRLSGISPCALADLPVCGTPMCLDQFTANMIAECIAGTQKNPDFDCTSLYTYALSRLPFCPGQPVMPPMPTCLTPDVVEIIHYCRQYPNANGPNKAFNAACWAITHDSAYWAALQALPTCGTGAPLEPPRHVTPPAAPPPMTASPPEGNSEASMSGMWGILALVAVGGGGYYLYRRYKK